MKTIRLYGELGKKFGKVHRLDVRTPSEAMRALKAIRPGFGPYLVKAEQNGMGFRVRNDGQDLDYKNLNDPTTEVIKVIPTPFGAGDATSRILVGAVLIAAAVVLGPASAGQSWSFIPGILGGMGFSLALGGVAQLLAPAPPRDDIPDRPENKPNYSFNGPVNTIAQGHPVPIGYGRLIVGGAVISAGITLDQLKTGFKRVKSDATRTVDITIVDGNVTQLYGGGKLPENWYKRVDMGLTPGAPGYSVRRWTYYYYVWTLVPL